MNASSDPSEPTADRVRRDLAATRSRLAGMEAEMAALVAASRDSNSDDEHDPEGQTIAFERSQLASLTERTRRHLGELEAALARVESGAWGRCERCGGPIGADRLEARPGATVCMACLAGRNAGGPRR